MQPTVVVTIVATVIRGVGSAAAAVIDVVVVDIVMAGAAVSPIHTNINKADASNTRMTRSQPCHFCSSLAFVTTGALEQQESKSMP